jgi:hypothetical protein
MSLTGEVYIYIYLKQNVIQIFIGLNVFHSIRNLVLSKESVVHKIERLKKRPFNNDFILQLKNEDHFNFSVKTCG